jgi:AAA+ superfamily predicted ATPase
MEEAKFDLSELYRLFRKKREEQKYTAIFRNAEEYLLVAGILGPMLDRRYHVIIYEVENFENLFDYADIFQRLRNVKSLDMFGYDLHFITVTTYPHEEDLVDAVQGAIEDGLTPIVAYFVGDFLPSEEAGSSDYKDLIRVLSMALFKKLCYVILFTTNPVVLYDNIPLARYGILMKDLAPRLIKKYHSDKAKFATTVGFGKVLRMAPDEIVNYIRQRKLPMPHTMEEITRDITFKELILPPSLKEFIKINVINPLKRDITLLSSILLIGPPGSGKTTLGYAIARELGVPAYIIRVELMSSKWLGETEKMANQTLLLANDRSPAVLIFRDAELILGERKGGGGEEAMVFERVRAIISSWLMSGKRRFFAVFTISNPKRVPEYVLYDATFGVFKLPILPPLKKEERKTMLSIFLSKLARQYDIYFDPLRESVNEALDTVAEETWAYTPRELFDIAKTAINITLDKGEKVLSKETIQLARKFKEIDRVARVEIMKETVRACKKVGIPEHLLSDVYKFEEEVEKLKALATAEEARKRSLVKLTK